MSYDSYDNETHNCYEFHWLIIRHIKNLNNIKV